MLLTLQEHDSTLERLLHRHHTLPERDALREAEGTGIALDGRLASARAERDRVAREEQQLDDEARTLAEKAKDVEARMYSGEISSPKELQAMQAEVEMFRKHQGTVENRELELMEVREPLDATVAELERQRAAALVLGQQPGIDARRDLVARGALRLHLGEDLALGRAERRRVPVGVGGDRGALLLELGDGGVEGLAHLHELEFAVLDRALVLAQLLDVGLHRLELLR